MKKQEFEQRFIAARRLAIGYEFSNLNEAQLEAVLTTQGPLLMLAGAGSGKTTALINRIANLLKFGSASDSKVVPDQDKDSEDDLLFLESYVLSMSDPSGNMGVQDFSTEDAKERIENICKLDVVEPSQIIAITFTNKAAGEIKERLERLLGSGADRIWAMTFHSACSRMLRRDIDKLGYSRSFTIYDTADSVSLMKRILKDLEIEERDFPPKNVLGYISRAKDRMTTAEEFFADAEKTGDLRRKTIGIAFLEYEERMKSSNALDFDDLILLTVRLFLENPDVLLSYRRKFKYVLIDEYQDTNNLQYLLASALAGGHGNICVVGDDDQSIYKFRGATIENILSFEKQFKNARVIRLEQNYRSTGIILDAANDVIRNNKGRKGKNLWTKNEPGIKPELHITENERTESQLIVDKIMTSSTDGISLRDYAILYRMNAQSNQLETAFKRHGLPYRIIGGTGFYERAEIKDMLAYLCIIHNPGDDVRLLRVINNPPRGIGDTTVGRLTALAAELNIPVFNAIWESQKHESLKKSSERLRSFAEMIDGLREAAESKPLDELYDLLLSRSGYVRMLQEKDSHENLSRLENVRELKTNIISFMNENENGGSLFDFLSETALYTDLDRDDSKIDRVNMMTMHSAKGLEFDTVFIVGAEEGVFPGIRAIGDPPELEEERRLCYVAMTRAKRRLYFTCAQQRMLFGKTSAAQLSRFVSEINDENIEIHEPFNWFSDSVGQGDGSAVPKRDSQPHWERQPHWDSRTVPLSLGQQAPDSKPKASLPAYKKGDVVDHTVFGRGIITNIVPGGGDALLEIAFDDIGTKRFMLNTAAKFMNWSK